ncbi:type II toxin-antitoxin system HicB family antitoxin [Myxacorys almedinensis]|uniref:Type II toxin-antitoxin system HicB family antitoxin n=1 Tax=Myxacorys almedinensis A TaxID=2690445 RepID=A0A8J7Z418_9CYAN|nr:type II toxin-antitoxin system HicB family antitoxin [Myxacorys almedinensis]NDJ16078.1 type II toxin-antitoxin system HicB family antitoxin [Myxacorys almedinensis A]
MNSQYSMIIQWSTTDTCYVVFLPDFAEVVMQPCTDGTTYEEAARHGQEVIESLVEILTEEGKPLPEPKTVPKRPLQHVA